MDSEIEALLQAPASAKRGANECGYSARSGILDLTFTPMAGADAAATVAQTAQEDGGTPSATHALSGLGSASVEVTNLPGPKPNSMAIVFTTGRTLVNLVWAPSSFRPIQFDVAKFEALARHIATLVP